MIESAPRIELTQHFGAFIVTAISVKWHQSRSDFVALQGMTRKILAMSSHHQVDPLGLSSSGCFCEVSSEAATER